VPDFVPAKRAVLAANMETALNALWDSGTGPGDRIAVVGGGVVGGLIAALAGALPGADVTLVDVLPARASLAEALGVRFAVPADAPRDCDGVFHASASQPGLQTALELAGFEGTVVEISWFGDREITVPLGQNFHSGRLKLISSQVGHVAASRRPRWNYARRMAKAMELLKNARLDALIGEEMTFADAPQCMAAVFGPQASGLAPVLRY
jgi:threonine dehydrogenase-like Zn-dependent dehydrogenase